MFALDRPAPPVHPSLPHGPPAAPGARVCAPPPPRPGAGGGMFPPPAAPARDGRTWYVPVDFVSRALASILPGRVELRKPSRLLLSGDVRLPRIAVRADPLGVGTTRVTIDVAPPTPHTVMQEATRLLIRFDPDPLHIPALP